MHARRASCAAPAAAALALALALAASGCRGPTRGELGKALFSYDEGAFGCLVGCPPADAPMAAGSRVIVYVTNADDIPDFTVSSSDESVATFSRLGTTTVKGHHWISISSESFAAGSTKLQLSDATSGGEIDRLALRVHDVQKIEIHDRDKQFHDQLTIMEGGSASMHMLLRDGSGQELVGHGGLDYAYQGAVNEPALLQLLFGEILTTIFVGTSPEYMEVSAQGAGSGSIVASSPAGATLEIPVRVIDASAVTSVKVEGEESAPKVGDTYFVNATAMAGNEPVHSPDCIWALSEVVGPVTIDSAGRDSASLKSAEPGSATVTCAIGSLASSIHLVFQ